MTTEQFKQTLLSEVVTSIDFVSANEETNTYLLKVDNRDIRMYAKTELVSFQFDMEDLAKSYNYESVDVFQKSSEWKELFKRLNESARK